MLTKAKMTDLNDLDKLAVLVIKDMKKSNIPQWELTYPRKEHFEKDINDNCLIIYKENNQLLGCMALLPENDPPYKTINSWIKEKSMVIHRVLVHPVQRNKGIAKKLLDYAIKESKQQGYESIKIDTHLENYKMRSFLSKNGFIELEYIKVMDRLAYELVLEETDE